MEFEGGVNKFRTGQIEREHISPLTWCINYFAGKYEELKPSYYRELGILYLTISKQQDPVKVDEFGN